MPPLPVLGSIVFAFTGILGKTQPSPTGLVFTHMFRWTPGVALEVLVLPWLPGLVSEHGFSHPKGLP
jgi:hypothetical protein